MASQIGRRKFLATLLGGAAATWPLATYAQQAGMPVIGLLATVTPEANAIRLRAFREGLRTAGYVEGQNVKVDYRWAEAHTGRLPELAGELVRDRVAVLVTAGGTASALAAKAATGVAGLFLSRPERVHQITTQSHLRARTRKLRDAA